MILRGEVTEIVGRPSSGRTSLLVACVREAMRDGGIAALVDADETFDPAAASRAGLDLRRLLWVRCHGRRDVALRATDVLVRCPGFALVAVDLGERPPRIPLTVAYRLRLTVRRTGTALVIVSGRRIVGPGAGLAIGTVRRALRWEGPAAVETRLAAVSTSVRVLRCRSGLQAAIPPDETRWWTA